jgi:methionyl-tRNA formyltransferase
MATPSPESWRVVLFTDQVFIVNFYKDFLTAHGHRLVGLVTSAKRNRSYLDVVGAAGAGVDVLLSEHPRRWGAMVAPLRPDLVISNVFPWLIPAAVLTLPRLGAVNLHGGLLPHQRGTDTLFHVLRAGDRESGVTLHRANGAFDAGPILAQVRYPIADNDILADLVSKALRAIRELWTDDVLARIAAGDPGEPQDESKAIYYGKIADEAAWKAIDWSQPARTVHNVVRSSGFARDLPPGAVGALDGAPHRITRTRLLPGATGDGPPGAVVGREAGALLVQCGDGPIAVVAYAPV